MLNSMPKLNHVTDKFDGWTEKLNAAKSALFDSPDAADLKPSKVMFKTTRRINEYVGADTNIAAFCAKDRTAFLSKLAKDRMLANWNTQSENSPSDDFAEMITEDDYDALKSHMPPLLLGFNDHTDYVELEYVSVADPQTGCSVAPVVTVETTKDGGSGNIYLNGRLAACVTGAANLCAVNVALVQTAVDN